MSRFYFHFRDGQKYDRDDEGIEFEGFEQAYLEAFRAALEMWTEYMSRLCDPRGCAFEIADGDGHVLAELPFEEVLESCRGGGKNGGSHALMPWRETCRRASLQAVRLKAMADEFAADIELAKRNVEETRELLVKAQKIAR